MKTDPITPPPELVQQWASESLATQNLCNRAAQWGADQELDACGKWLDREGWSLASRQLRAARRPKPPSLKEQALQALQRAEEGWRPIPDDCDTIRRALEALDD